MGGAALPASLNHRAVLRCGRFLRTEARQVGWDSNSIRAGHAGPRAQMLPIVHLRRRRPSEGRTSSRSVIRPAGAIPQRATRLERMGIITFVAGTVVAYNKVALALTRF